jgi:LAO/AO transport system kinase
MSDSKKKAADRAIAGLKKKATPMAANAYLEGILKGDVNLLSQAITLIESAVPAHRKIAEEIINGCLPHTGNAIRIGITGVPGVGKSTFIESFGSYLISNFGKKLAVLAIDPSSPISKGSILGDKTRMEELSMNKSAFIRPSPSADTLGGVAQKTRESLLLCEAAGFDVILIETVGVGQSETAVHQMTDFFLLLMLAGAGDQLQGIKRGIMEMCDALVITKADGENVPAANRAKAEYLSALHFYPPKESGWIPKVDACSALTKEGMDRVWNIISQHHQWLAERGLLQSIRTSQDLSWMKETLTDKVLQDYFQSPEIIAEMRKMETEISEKKITPFQAAERLFGLKKN